MNRNQMKYYELTNDNLWSTEFSRNERIACIASMPMPKEPKKAFLCLGLPAASIWMNDVSAMDRRSIKAQLAGRGDGRELWWNLCAFVLQRFYREHKLEWAMYRFHQFHNEVHLFRREFAGEARSLKDSVKQRGFMRAMKDYCLST